MKTELSNVFVKYSPYLLPGYKEFIIHETAATAISYFHSQVVPGLLQTEDYMRAVINGIDTSLMDERSKEQWVKVRLLRQWETFERKTPPEIKLVIEESVLHRQFGGPTVLRDQLLHLVRLGSLNHIKIHVLPTPCALMWPCFAPVFTLMWDQNCTVPNLVSLEDMLGQNNKSDPMVCRIYNASFQKLRQASYSHKASLELMQKIAEETGPNDK